MSNLTLTGKLVGWTGGDGAPGTETTCLLIQTADKGAQITFCNPNMPLEFLGRNVLYMHNSRGQVLIAGEIDESSPRTLGITATMLKNGKPAILEAVPETFYRYHAVEELVEYCTIGMR